MIKLVLKDLKMETIQECVTCSDPELREAAKSFLEGRLDAGELEAKVPEKMKDLTLKASLDLSRSDDERLSRKGKQQVITAYSPYIYSIIYGLYSQLTPQYTEDLFQSGVKGLLDALGRYDGNGAFITYATFHINHELCLFQTFLEGNPSRYYGTLQRKVRKAIDSMRGEGKEPDASEISRRTGISVKIVTREMKLIAYKLNAPIQISDEEEFGFSGLGSSLEDRVILRADLEAAMSSMAKVERIALLLHCLAGISYARISKLLGIEEHKLRAREKKNVERLRILLVEYDV